MKKYILSLLLLMGGLSLFAQQVIKGNVKSENGEDLIGVSIKIKGTFQGVITDINGNFEISASSDDILVFSYIGYTTQEVALSEKTPLNITMSEDITTLSDVVVKGFATIDGQARKRRESLQDTPESVSAMSSKDIEITGLSGVAGVINKIPNVTFNDYQDEANFSINVRGITQIRDGESPVSIVIDDVQLPFHQSLNQDFYEIEHIEVVKGPQGTLYGKNAIAGAINIVTKQPENELGGLVKASYATGQNLKFTGALSGGLVEDKMFFRLGGTFGDFRGYDERKNTFLNEFTDNKKNWSIRGQLMTKLSNNLSLDLKGQAYNSETGTLYYITGPLANGQSHTNDFTGSPNANILGSGEYKSNDFFCKIEL